MGKQAAVSTAAPATCIGGMSGRARRVVEALQEGLLPNPDTVAAYVTGSQARGTATKKSDLDIYHIVRGTKRLQKHYDAIKSIAAVHMEQVDVVVDTLETFGRNANLYGSFEYQAVRDGILIYEDQSSDDRLTVRGMIADVRLPDCAAQWIKFAKQHIDAGELYVRNGGLTHSHPCIMCAKSISASLMAALTHDNIRFKFTRRLADLAGMLHDRSIIRGHDINKADMWRRVWRDNIRVTVEDRLDAMRMADSIYVAVKSYTENGRRIAQH